MISYYSEAIIRPRVRENSAPSAPKKIQKYKNIDNRTSHFWKFSRCQCCMPEISILHENGSLWEQPYDFAPGVSTREILSEGTLTNLVLIFNALKAKTYLSMASSRNTGWLLASSHASPTKIQLDTILLQSSSANTLRSYNHDTKIKLSTNVNNVTNLAHLGATKGSWETTRNNFKCCSKLFHFNSEMCFFGVANGDCSPS